MANVDSFLPVYSELWSEPPSIVMNNLFLVLLTTTGGVIIILSLFWFPVSFGKLISAKNAMTADNNLFVYSQRYNKLRHADLENKLLTL